MRGILGKKIGMSQIFREDGICVPVTNISAGPCYVVQVKDAEQDGYRAVQLGFEEKKPKHTKKPEAGHFAKAKVAPQKFMREIRVAAEEQYESGQKLSVDMFKAGEFVDVTGVSIGKGFQGGMRRWGWHGGPKTHGSMSHRRIGSVGATTTPGRIVKGHHLPGHMGNARITVQSLEIISVDAENNVLAVKGAVPGPRGGYLVIRKARKK